MWRRRRVRFHGENVRAGVEMCHTSMPWHNSVYLNKEASLVSAGCSDQGLPMGVAQFALPPRVQNCGHEPSLQNVLNAILVV